MSKRLYTFAFSLVELMIVILIVAVLISIAVIQFQNYSKKSKIVEGSIIMSSIASHEINFYSTRTLKSDFTENVQTFVASNTRTPSLADIGKSKAKADWKNTSPFMEISFDASQWTYGSYGVSGSGTMPETSIDITAIFDLVGGSDCTENPAYGVKEAQEGCTLMVQRLSLDEKNQPSISPLIQSQKD